MNSDLYCDILVNKLKPGIRNKRRGKLSKGVIFLHDNARPHTSCKTLSTIIKLGFEVLEHPAYSPDLAPSDYFLFGLLKKELKGKRFDSDEDVQKVVQDFFHTLPKSAYKEGIYKLPERWRRCIETQGTAHRWYENVEEKINSWDILVKMFSQNFGHHVTQKDQLAENLKTRAQGKEETSDYYIQDVLHLCREVNPAMMENEIVAHLTKGILEEIYQSIIILDIATIDEFIKWCRKIEASNKKRVNKRVVFDRLPNVAAIDSADSKSMEDLIRRIVREEVHRTLNPESTTPEPSSLKEII
ncbi:hypothetical protein LAZ67_19001936 [Cordylochernes scorpioides]|uniref:Retrotransposon gag domain-containing protein n=1 Tax=Cordylochernes scorpioides TaxID=51811 RepID=A0ABY6LMB0_9ARAC|nr:hypothetical protein LAZ67_19001936 [Cordylochernes scorpioides]